jgi:hypothetical protein
VAGLVAFIFGMVVWPTPYEVHRGPRDLLVRVNRFTGHAEPIVIDASGGDDPVDRMEREERHTRGLETLGREVGQLREMTDSSRFRFCVR